MSSKGKIRSVKKIDALLDDIKDEVDGLANIANPRRRVEAARDLVEYINLHHIDASFEES